MRPRKVFRGAMTQFRLRHAPVDNESTNSAKPESKGFANNEEIHSVVE